MRRASIAAVVFAAALGTAALGVALFATRGSSVTRSLVYAKQSTRGSTIWRANVDGSHPVRLAAGRDPQISPGGRLVAFVGREKPPTAINWSLPSSSILTIPASGGRIETLVRVSPVGLNVAWAPDSRHLAVGSRHGLYVVDLGTGSRKLVAHGNESSADYSPSFSPDSNSLVYRLPRRGGSNIVVTDLKSGRSRLIAQSDDGPGGPVWGSEEIAFTSAGELWLIDGRGKHLRRFRNGAAKVTGVAGPLLWSADGADVVAARAIVVKEKRLRAVRMPVFDIAKNRLRSVKPPTGWDYQVALSRNGRIVLMGSCRHETTGEGVIAVPLTGGKPRTIVKDACSASWNA